MKLKKFLTELRSLSLILLVVGLVGGGLVALMYFHWTAYFERFPNASWWTYFFKK